MKGVLVYGFMDWVDGFNHFDSRILIDCITEGSVIWNGGGDYFDSRYLSGL